METSCVGKTFSPDFSFESQSGDSNSDKLVTECMGLLNVDLNNGDKNVRLGSSTGDKGERVISPSSQLTIDPTTASQISATPRKTSRKVLTQRQAEEWTSQDSDLTVDPTARTEICNQTSKRQCHE